MKNVHVKIDVREDEWITSAEAAKKKGISIQKMQRALAAGRVPGAKKELDRWFVPRVFDILPGTRGPKGKL